MPKRASPAHSVEPMAHMRSVHERPTLSSMRFKMNGNAKPAWEEPRLGYAVKMCMKRRTSNTATCEDDASGEAFAL